MPELSPIFREFYGKTIFNADIGLVDEYLSKLQIEQEIIVGKLFRAQVDYFFNGKGDLEHTLNEYKDKILSFHELYHVFYYFAAATYYAGFNEPPLDRDLSRELITKYTELVDKLVNDPRIGDWEKTFIKGLEYFLLEITGDTLEEKLKMVEGRFAMLTELPEFNINEMTGSQNRGIYLYALGRFDEAFEELLKVWNYYRTNTTSISSIFSIGNMTQLAVISGKLTRMRNILEEAIEFVTNGEDEILLSVIYHNLGRVSQVEEKFEEAEKYYHRSLDLIDPEIYPIYFFNFSIKLISMYLSQYEISNQNELLIKGQQVIDECNNKKHLLSKSYYYDRLRLQQARKLAFGGFRQKGQAAMMMEDLVEKYPDDVEFLTNYLELLFQELLVSSTEETMSEIERIIHKLSDIPLREDPKAIGLYVPQVILKAKYNYYLKSDYETALRILYDTQEHINKYSVPSLQTQLEYEINKYKEEYQKWQNASNDTKNRMLMSDIRNYMKFARQFLETQK